MGKLDGRVAIVTGGAQGMGAAHCEILAREGADVVVCDIDEDHGAAVAERVGGHFHHLDVSDDGQWTRVVDDVTRSLGPIGVLVNNAGLAAINAVQDTPTEEWNRILAVNLSGCFFGIRAVVPSMRATTDGVIVNISSDAGLTGMPHIAAYAASKWGVRGLTRSAALDLAPYGIRVVSIHPGIIRTPMSEGVDLDAFVKSRPLPRPGEVDELARMLLFVVADATFSTGCEFVADGGNTAGTTLPL